MTASLKKYRIGCLELSSTYENGSIILAHDHGEAAEIWAQKEDSESAEYWIVKNGKTTVEVKEDGSTNAPKTLRVYAETSISYYSEEIFEVDESKDKNENN